MESGPDANAGASVFWWRMPDDTSSLMDLGHLELRAWIAIARAIQRDRNKGRLSIRQIRKRAHSGSVGRTCEAVNAVCDPRFQYHFTRHNPITGARLTEPEQWKGREVEYRLNLDWKQRDADNCSPNRNSLEEKAVLERNCSPKRNRTVPQTGTELFPKPEQHLECLESSDHNRDIDYQPTNRKNRDSSPGRGVESRYPGLQEALSRYMDGEGQEPMTASERTVVDVMEAASGATEGDVIACLKYLRIDRGLKPGTRNGPTYWAWFKPVVAEYFVQKRAMANPAGPQPGCSGLRVIDPPGASGLRHRKPA